MLGATEGHERALGIARGITSEALCVEAELKNSNEIKPAPGVKKRLIFRLE